MKTRQITVTQLRLYSSDTISLATISTPVIADRIKDQFKFRSYSPKTGNQGPALVFEMGAFIDGDSTFAIRLLAVGSRRLELQIEARSEVADRFHSELAAFLVDLLPGKIDLTAPTHKSETTVSTTDLELNLDALVNAEYKAFLEQVVGPTLAQPEHKVRLSPVQVGVLVSWTPNEGTSPQVRLVERPLRLEVRQGTRPEERIFFVSYPGDSQTHDKILVALEEVFRAKQ